MQEAQSVVNNSAKHYIFLDRQKMALVHDLMNNNEETGGMAMRNLIKVKRWEAGLKQYELAYLLGCSAPYLSMVENQRVEATEDFKQKAAEIFGVPINELFGENGN